MGRQPLWRRVSFIPNVTYFKPAGVSLVDTQEVCISIEETEAIRLKDFEGLDQDTCAQKMKVSRSTFARILLMARQKLSDALLNGKAIRIAGGNYELTKRSFRCGNGHQWEVPFEIMVDNPPALCPTCNTADIMSLMPWKPGLDSNHGRFRGRWNR